MAFDTYSRYYDLLYRDKDYAGEVDYIEGLIRKASPDACSILELGCGTGRHAALLADRGFTVTGVDMSATMLEAAEERRHSLSERVANSIRFECGDVRSYRTDTCFDAVVSLFHVASYQVTNADMQMLMNTASQHVRDGGVFIFDFWYGPAVLSERPTIRVKRLDDAAIRVVRIAEPELFPNENRVNVNYSISVSEKGSERTEEINEVHRMRYFFLTEIERFLVDSGFATWRAEEWMTGRALGVSSWGACVVARK